MEEIERLIEELVEAVQDWAERASSIYCRDDETKYYWKRAHKIKLETLAAIRERIHEDD